MDGSVSEASRAGPESTDGGLASLTLGLLLLATDEVRAMLDAARRQLGFPVAQQTVTGDDGGRGGLRQPLIGAVLDLQRQVILTGVRLGRPWWHGASRTAVRVWQAPPLDGLRSRAEAEAARLARSGVEQEARARRLAAATVAMAVHRVTGVLLDQEFEAAYQRAIARVLETPEIAELVRTQSTGLAQELATAVRDRAATGDELFERVVGRLLRRRAGDVDVPAPLPRIDGAEA